MLLVLCGDFATVLMIRAGPYWVASFPRAAHLTLGWSRRTNRAPRLGGIADRNKMRTIATAGRDAPPREPLNLAGLRTQSAGVRIGLPRDGDTRAFVFTDRRETPGERNGHTPETSPTGRYRGGRLHTRHPGETFGGGPFIEPVRVCVRPDYGPPRALHGRAVEFILLPSAIVQARRRNFGPTCGPAGSCDRRLAARLDRPSLIPFPELRTRCTVAHPAATSNSIPDRNGGRTFSLIPIDNPERLRPRTYRQRHFCQKFNNPLDYQFVWMFAPHTREMGYFRDVRGNSHM